MKQNIYLSIIAALSLLTSCDDIDKASSNPATEVKISNDHVNINYADTKIGDTTLLFIHGWGIDKSYWQNQVDFFSKRYRVVTVDLPGFGQSGKNRSTWSVENYGRDISTVLQALDLKHVIVIGHSMSGAIAIETALNNHDRIVGVVGIDNFKNYGVISTPKSDQESAEVYKAARAHYKETVGQYVNQALFSPSTDSTTRHRVLNDILNADSSISVTILEKGDSYPLNERLKLFKKTLFLINSDFTPTDTSSFRKAEIDYYLLDVGPTGHYPMLEKPNEFNLLLQKAIDKME